MSNKIKVFDTGTKWKEDKTAELNVGYSLDLLIEKYGGKRTTVERQSPNLWLYEFEFL